MRPWAVSVVWQGLLIHALFLVLGARVVPVGLVFNCGNCGELHDLIPVLKEL